MKSSRLAGHALPREGRIFDNDYRIQAGFTRCSCGEKSPVLPSDNARREWHAQHKADIRQQIANRLIGVPPCRTLQPPHERQRLRPPRPEGALMGYVTNFQGEIAITPPIPWGQVKNSPFLPDSARRGGGKDIMFRLVERERETDEGVVCSRSAVALVSTWEDDARGYEIVEHVQEAIDAHPDHEFRGRLDCYGSDPGDLWRLEVHDRQAVKVQPRIVWPDGSEEPMR